MDDGGDVGVWVGEPETVVPVGLRVVHLCECRALKLQIPLRLLVALLLNIIYLQALLVYQIVMLT